MDRERSIAVGVGFGISEEVATAVVDAYVEIGARAHRQFDPASWSRTVWYAEAARWERSPSPQAHATLVLSLQDLSERWEEMFGRNARGWRSGKVGERLTKR
ncbi:MAG TPA: hypothetical protein DCZ72_00345 [Armatimonadetes bacterium]|nr:hypothetical protein [Armatimonadota bacterium]